VSQRLDDLRYVEPLPCAELYIITGRGSHSGGKAKLKSKVSSFLMRRGIAFREQEHNPGCLVICLMSNKLCTQKTT
jgi:hypothetical protein